MGDRDDLDDVMETSLTNDYDKQWLNCVSTIGPWCLLKGHDVCERDMVFAKETWCLLKGHGVCERDMVFIKGT